MKTKTNTRLKCEYFIRMTECGNERQEDKTPKMTKGLKKKRQNKEVGGLK